jgi:ATP-dependent Lon protease
MTQKAELLPVLPLRDVVVYPHMVIPLFVGREKSIKALDKAMDGNKQIILVAQKSAANDDPGEDETYTIGTMANILQLLKLPDGTIKVLVEGTARAGIKAYRESDGMFVADVELLEAKVIDEQEMDVHVRSAMNQFEQYVKLNKKVPPEIISSLTSIDDPSRLADTIAAHMSIKIEEKQQVLEIIDIKDRLEHLIHLMDAEIDLLQVEKRIRGRVKTQMEKSQREYYLNEQMKAIQKELGEMEDVPNEIEELANKIEKAGMHKDAKEKAEAELKKLRMMSPMSAEASVVRS